MNGLHACVVVEFPLVLGRDVLVVEERAAALGPADGLALREAPGQHGVVREVLEAQVEEGAVEGETESPPDLHY